MGDPGAAIVVVFQIEIAISISNKDRDRDRDRDLNFGDRAHALFRRVERFGYYCRVHKGILIV